VVKPAKAGFSLISVVVAGGIVGIALTLAASAIIGGARLSEQAVHLTAASSFAEGVMEQLTAQRYESITRRTVTDDLPRLSEVRCTVDVTERDGALKEVVVTCSWQERERPRSVRFATLVAKGGAR
jgi:type II secretory pathway pseudopilin PulG